MTIFDEIMKHLRSLSTNESEMIEVIDTSSPHLYITKNFNSYEEMVKFIGNDQISVWTPTFVTVMLVHNNEPIVISLRRNY